MCTAIVSIEPGSVLVAGIRDELVNRPWRPPGQHWPDYPGVRGGLDLMAGGTWLAVAPAAGRVACVLNGRGVMAPAGSRRSRGALPLDGVARGKPGPAGLADFDPFHLLIASPGMAVMYSWDGEHFAGRGLGDGLHMIVNSGLAGEPAGEGTGRDHELARIACFLPLLRAAPRPDPRPGSSAERAWGAWLPLMNGGGIDPEDPRALIVRRDLGAGRIWGTTSVSLVALTPGGLRYDFSGAPGDPAAWQVF